VPGRSARAWFTDIKIPHKFSSAYVAIHNHFNQDGYLNSFEIFKQNRAAALAEWCELAAGKSELWGLWRLVRIILTPPHQE